MDSQRKIKKVGQHVKLSIQQTSSVEDIEGPHYNYFNLNQYLSNLIKKSALTISRSCSQQRVSQSTAMRRFALKDQCPNISANHLPTFLEDLLLPREQQNEAMFPASYHTHQWFPVHINLSNHAVPILIAELMAIFASCRLHKVIFLCVCCCFEGFFNVICQQT